MHKESVGFATEATCFVVREAVSPQVCERLIASAELRGIAVTGVEYPPSYRSNDRLVFDDPVLATWLYGLLGSQLPNELSDDSGTWHRVGLNTRFRVCRYEGGQSFRIHQDGAHTVGEDIASRLTCQLYLNSAHEFSGGATRFYAARHGDLLGVVRPECGTVIVFDHQLWHDGEAVPAGCKYVLRTDVLYRREDPAPATPTSDGMRLLGHRGYVWSVISLGAGRLASASRDRSIRLWQRASQGWHCGQVLTGAASSVSSLARVGAALWSGSRDHTLTRWDLETGQPTVLHRGDGAVLCIATHGDQVLVGAADGKLHRFATDGELIDSRLVSSTWLWTIAGLDTERLVCGDEAGVLHLLSRSPEAPAAALRPTRGAVHALHRLEDGRLAAGFADGSLAVYQLDGATLRELHHVPAHLGEVYALSSHGLTLASGGEDGQVHLWDVTDTPARSASHLHPGFVRSVAFSEDGTLASGCYDGLVRIFASSQLCSGLPRSTKRDRCG